MRLKDRVSLITGAAQGIGKEIALTFAKEGSDIIIFDVNLEEANKTKQDVESLGRKSTAFEVDITDYKVVQDCVNKILDKFIKIDILVNNAGIVKDSLILRMTESDWDRVIDVNLKGAFNCIKAVSKAMLKQRRGKIINIASIIGLIGNVGQANYSASKAGMIALTKTAAKEFASRGILVNAVLPGFIKTQMTESLSEEVKKEILERIPLQRFGEPKDVADLCLFLASDESNYITGQTFIVDGGMVTV
jgi:3-oxoacyl-[acyl-carrier protein] reductase